MKTALPPIEFIVQTALNSHRRRKAERSHCNHEATRDESCVLEVAVQEDQTHVGFEVLWRLCRAVALAPDGSVVWKTDTLLNQALGLVSLPI